MSTSEPEKPTEAETQTPAEAEITPTPADLEAEEATEVVLEADAEAEGEPAAVDEPATGDEPVAAPVAAPKVEETESAPASRRTQPPARRRAPAPARRRGRPAPEPGAAPPVVRAHAKYVRSSARKARLVCDHIRGKSVEEARAILAHTPRAVARDWSKLLESAVANAEHNHELVGEDLVIKAVHADEGPTIKRFRPRAMGRATSIRKRTSHLTILLTPKV
jgi:large subunit ribosomal protein L22